MSQRLSPSVRILLTVVLVLAAVPAQARNWYYYAFGEQVPLTLDTTQILIYDPTPEATVVPRLLPTPHGALPTEPLAGNWSTLDLTGTPSEGDPVAVEALVADLSSDPTTDYFVSTVFTDGTGVYKLVPPHVAVGFWEGVPEATVLADLASAGLGSILEPFLWPNSFIVDGAARSGIEVLDRVNILAESANLEWAAPDFGIYGPGVVSTEAGSPPPVAVRSFKDLQPSWLQVPQKAAACIPLPTVDDEYFGDSWGLSQASDIDVDAEVAWGLCSGDGEAVVAVIDSGVDPNHPDLVGRVVLGADFTGECTDCDGTPEDECDRHGVAVAGVLAAASNQIGTLGIAPNVKILTVRAGKQYPNGSRTSCYGLMHPTNAARAIDYAANQGALGTVLSWNWTTNLEPPMVKAYQAAYDLGIFHVNSAGNNNEEEVRFPGNMPEVMSISGINYLGERYVNSNTGADVTVAAPAEDILTTDIIGGIGWSDETGPRGDAAAFVTGTSFAAPLVAGLAMLTKLINPSLGPSSISFLLRTTADDYDPPGRDDTYGDGVANAGKCATEAPNLIFASDFEVGRFSDWSAVVSE